PNTPMPYPAARLHPDRTPCVMKVRGSRDGVSDAAKKSVPRRMPTAEKERHNRTIRYRITASSVADGGGSRQLPSASYHYSRERSACVAFGVVVFGVALRAGARAWTKQRRQSGLPIPGRSLVAR